MASEFNLRIGALEEMYPFHTASESSTPLMGMLDIKPISSVAEPRTVAEIARDSGYSVRHTKNLLTSGRVNGHHLGDDSWLVNPVAFANYRVSIGKSAF